ncbi:MAG: NERD domain-containing protein [Bacilli bacterium]|nr:NERD domain-containing protein [Bacilli bacterium]
MAFEVKVTIFIVAAILVGAALLFWFFYKPVKRFIFRNSPNEVFYQKIIKIVRDRDLYLINNFEVEFDKGKTMKIDHIIGGDKYIYIINDRYFDGTIVGSATDDWWRYFTKGRKDAVVKTEIVNPLMETKNMIIRLSIQRNLPIEYVVGIVLINDDCFVTGFKNIEGAVQLTTYSQLEKVIKKYESQQIGNINPDDLHKAIHDLYEISEETKNGKQ